MFRTYLGGIRPRDIVPCFCVSRRLTATNTGFFTPAENNARMIGRVDTGTLITNKIHMLGYLINIKKDTSTLVITKHTCRNRTCENNNINVPLLCTGFTVWNDGSKYLGLCRVRAGVV